MIGRRKTLRRGELTPAEKELVRNGAYLRADGRCELDDKECIWARIYERLKSYGESQTMLDGPLAFYNAELDRTSSWANFYLERDHTAKKNDANEMKPG